MKRITPLIALAAIALFAVSCSKGLSPVVETYLDNLIEGKYSDAAKVELSETAEDDKIHERAKEIFSTMKEFGEEYKIVSYQILREYDDAFLEEGTEKVQTVEHQYVEVLVTLQNKKELDLLLDFRKEAGKWAVNFDNLFESIKTLKSSDEKAKEENK